MSRLTYVITPADDGRALGDVLRRCAGMSRKAVIHAKFREDGILLDGVRVRTTTAVRAGQVASVAVDAEAAVREACSVAPCASEAAVASVGVLYEDDALAVVDKPAGMVMYPGPGHAGDTLGNVMLARAAAAGRETALHPVQRLDGGTSGVVVFAYNPHVQHALQRALHTGAFVREYVAFCEGVPGAGSAACVACGAAADAGEGGEGGGATALGNAGCEVAFAENPVLTCENGEFTVDAPIARISYSPNVFAAVAANDARGKAARTHFRVEDSFTLQTPTGERVISRLRLRLETGRTHQIRIHLALIGHPLLGDEAYGNGAFTYLAADGTHTLARPALHSAHATLIHPMTAALLNITSPLPADLATLLPTPLKTCTIG